MQTIDSQCIAPPHRVIISPKPCDPGPVSASLMNGVTENYFLRHYYYTIDAAGDATDAGTKLAPESVTLSLPIALELDREQRERGKGKNQEAELEMLSFTDSFSAMSCSTDRARCLAP